MAGRTDLPRHVAIERLDLDDVGTIVAEHLGGIGAHQHGRHVDDLDALQRSHGVVCSRCVFFSEQVTAAEREDQGFPAHGRMYLNVAPASSRAPSTTNFRIARSSGASRFNNRAPWLWSPLP